MKKIFVFLSFTLVCAVTASRAQSPTPPAEQITVIRAGTVIDGSNASPRKNQLIFIRANHNKRNSNRSFLRHSATRTDRFTYAHFSVGRRSRQRRLRRKYFESRHSPARRPRHLRVPPRSRARFHHHPRFRNRRRRLWRHRNKTSHRRRHHPRSAHLRRHARHFHHRRLQPGRLRARIGNAKRRATSRRPSRSPQSRPPAIGAWGR